jgi:HEAT repeat protein
LVEALGEHGEKAASAVPLMTALFAKSSNDRDLKVAIIQTLGKIGPGAKDALPLLSKQLQSPDENVRRAAAEAIQAITKR